MSDSVNCFLSQIKTYQRNNHLGIQDQQKNTLEDKRKYSGTRLIYIYIKITYIALEGSVHVIVI